MIVNELSKYSVLNVLLTSYLELYFYFQKPSNDFQILLLEIARHLLAFVVASVVIYSMFKFVLLTLQLALKCIKNIYIYKPNENITNNNYSDRHLC